MSTKSKKIVAEAMIAAALGLSALGLGAGVANAKPHGPGIPWIPGPGHGDWEDGGDGGRGLVRPGIRAVPGADPGVRQCYRSVGVRHRHRVHLAADRAADPRWRPRRTPASDGGGDPPSSRKRGRRRHCRNLPRRLYGQDRHTAHPNRHSTAHQCLRTSDVIIEVQILRRGLNVGCSRSAAARCRDVGASLPPYSETTRQLADAHPLKPLANELFQMFSRNLRR